MCGGHWRVAVRHGIEGQRALCGNLTFDTSDMIALVADTEIMVRTIARVAAIEACGSLRADPMVHAYISSDRVAAIVELCATNAWRIAERMLREQLGIKDITE